MSRLPFHTPYADYDVLVKRDTPSWDALTRDVVARRLHDVPTRRFFAADEWSTLEAVCARLMPQPERADHPIPIVPWIDAKLHLGESEGYRYADLPPLDQAWRRALRGLDQDSERMFGRAFRELGPDAQDAVLRAIQQGEVQGEAWRAMSAPTFFASVLMGDVVSFYYAHPDAWSEIGFGGPASPRGYVRLDMDRTDPWEARQQQERGKHQ